MEVVKDTSSIVDCATDIVDCSVAEMICEMLDVAMFLIELPVMARVDRITVIKGSDTRLFPSIKLFLKTIVPKNEERKAF